MPVPRVCPAGRVCDVTGVAAADQPCPEGHFCLEGTATTATTCGHPRYTTTSHCICTRHIARNLKFCNFDRFAVAHTVDSLPNSVFPPDTMWRSPLNAYHADNCPILGCCSCRSPSSRLFPTLSHAERTSTLRPRYEPLGSDLVLGSRAAACWNNATEDIGLQMSDLPTRCVWLTIPGILAQAPRLAYH